MIRRMLKLRSVRIVLGIYALLWMLTAVIGNARIDLAFDAWNRDGAGIKRIHRFHVLDLHDPRNEPLIPANGLFRYRSHGLAIGPFVVIDEIATIFAPLGGLGAVRLSLWCFGPPKSWIIYTYWNA
jgi:hypothetical protein